MKKKYLLGFDIGGTKCSIVLGSSATGNPGGGIKISILDKITISTEHGSSPYPFIEKLFSTAEKMIKKISGSKSAGGVTGFIESIGISCGGPLDSRRGIILSPPNLPEWEAVPISSLTEKRFNVKAYLENDANAGAIAEWLYGAGRGKRNMIFLTFGTGLGAGLILNGRLYTGTNDLAGEVGHIRISKEGPEGYGKNGSFEGFCSGTGIANLARTEILKMFRKGIRVNFCPTVEAAKKITAKDVCDAAKHGDPIAVDILKTSGHYLGRGLSLLIDILNPELIIIGSVFARCGEFLKPEMKRIIELEALRPAEKVCDIVSSRLGEQIGDYAALAVASQKYRRN
ncbi:MAG: ROK family protein [Spirochaetales bacterium]|nr:ROK family protein [Spirochaetales bacterium]